MKGRRQVGTKGKLLTIKVSGDDPAAVSEAMTAFRKISEFGVFRVSAVQHDSSTGVYWQFCDIMLHGGES